MEQLTQRNGVMCKYCFRTIDLSTIKIRQKSIHTRYMESIYGIDEISITCPFCEKISNHSKKDIKPIQSGQGVKQELQKRIEELEKENKKLQKENENLRLDNKNAVEQLSEVKEERDLLQNPKPLDKDFQGFK